MNVIIHFTKDMEPESTERQPVVLMSVERTIPAGQVFRCDVLMRSTITIETGATLEVAKSAMNNTIIIKDGGKLDIQGVDMKNTITHE